MARDHSAKERPKERGRSFGDETPAVVSGGNEGVEVVVVADGEAGDGEGSSAMFSATTGFGGKEVGDPLGSPDVWMYASVFSSSVVSLV